MKRDSASSPGAALGGALAVFTAMLLALLVRALGFEYVFVAEEIVFPPADPQYHLRRALYTMTRFPDVLLFDPYINFPGGASVPWPPLFDWTLGGLGRLAGGTPADLERVAAWAAPGCAAIAVWPIYLTGARIASRRTGAIAALLFALLPISVVYTRVGNADHHAAVGMIGAWLLYALLSLVDPEATRRRMIGLAVLLFAVRTAMLLTWHGSLLYLAPAEGLLLLAGVVTGRRALLAAQAGSALASLVVIALVLSLSPAPLGGPYSSIALSRLHGLAVAAVVVTSGGILLASRLGVAETAGRRLVWSAGAGIAFVLTLVVVPDTRDGLTFAYQFLSLGDEVGGITGEQTPLFAVGAGDRLLGPPAVHSWGFFAYLLPLCPLAALLVGRRLPGPPTRRAAGWVLFGWGLFFCTLASLQRRYGNDAAPAASLLFALALCWGVGRVAELALPRLDAPLRRTFAAVLAAALVPLCLAPAIADVYLPRARASWAALGAPTGPSRGALTSVAYTLHRFAGEVGAVTRPTAGYLDASGGPEYGVLAHANLGHALQYRARRATATDPFWWYIGRENWDRSLAFFEATREGKALALARALSARYVVTMPGLAARSVVGRLHDADGRGRGDEAALGRFRLVTEAPRGGLSVGALFGEAAASAVPYKLFEIVPGAVIETPAEPGSRVSAVVEVVTPTGRRIAWRSMTRAARDGVARLRVPYATPGAGTLPAGRRARADGPYRVRADGAVLEVDVSEDLVRRGGGVRARQPARRAGSGGGVTRS